MRGFGDRHYFEFMGAKWSIRSAGLSALKGMIETHGYVPNVEDIPYSARRVKRIPTTARYLGRYHGNIEPPAERAQEAAR